MTNYVPINNTILRDIVRCFNSQYWSRFMHKRVGLVFDEKTHCFQSYIQGYGKTSNIYMNKYQIFNDQNNFLHILVCVVSWNIKDTAIIKAYRLKYK